MSNPVPAVRRYLRWSEDGARTWSELQSSRGSSARLTPTWLASPATRSLPSTRIATRWSSGHSRRISHDLGKTWEPKLYILADGVGYASSVGLDDGTIVTVTGDGQVAGGKRSGEGIRSKPSLETHIHRRLTPQSFNLFFRYPALRATGWVGRRCGWVRLGGEVMTEELRGRRQAQSLQQGSLRCVGLKWLHDASALVRVISNMSNMNRLCRWRQKSDQSGGHLSTIKKDVTEKRPGTSTYSSLEIGSILAAAKVQSLTAVNIRSIRAGNAQASATYNSHRWQAPKRHHPGSSRAARS